MKVIINNWHAIAQWRWDTGNPESAQDDDEGDVCGICRVAYEACCPSCKVPGDDCPLSAFAIRLLAIPASRSSLTSSTQYGENVVTSFICIVC
jgi:hypothetical protein